MDKWETDLKASFENYATITFNKISDISSFVRNIFLDVCVARLR